MPKVHLSELDDDTSEDAIDHLDSQESEFVASYIDAGGDDPVSQPVPLKVSLLQRQGQP
jgi:hypothetical protein